MSLSDAWSDQATKQAIQEAILLERERCAKKAEDESVEFHPHDCGCSGCEMSTRIAAAIRSGK